VDLFDLRCEAKAMNDQEIICSVLFARRDSVYKMLPSCDVWDIDRDARKWPGGTPVICHPPCRAWARLRYFARPSPDEKELALFAVDQVRSFGGALEHPVGSTLWPEACLPVPGAGKDRHNGYTLPVNQNWFGHRAQKATLLYIVGCAPGELPPIPYNMEEPSHVVQTRKRDGSRPHITKSEREHTPILFAKWLVSVAQLCERKP
jgi:hypothetical protein